MTLTERTAPRGNGGAGRGRPPKIDLTECVALWRAGKSTREIAAVFQVTSAAVTYRLRQAMILPGDRPTGTPRPMPAAPVEPRFRAPAAGWDEQAACAGVDHDGRDRFHPATTLDPDAGNPTAARSYEIARLYCRACPVTIQCLTAALAAETPSTRAGIWGGLSPRQRADLTPDSDLRAAITAALTPRPYGTRTRHPHTVQASDRTDFTDAEQRAANAAVDRWRRRRGPEPTADQVAAYRAYQRRSRATRRQATG